MRIGTTSSRAAPSGAWGSVRATWGMNLERFGGKEDGLVHAGVEQSSTRCTTAPGRGATPVPVAGGARWLGHLEQLAVRHLRQGPCMEAGLSVGTVPLLWGHPRAP